jgi:hypothetical protein
MTVGGWSLTRKVHIGDDYCLAYWSCFAGASVAWNVIWALNTEWPL